MLLRILLIVTLVQLLSAKLSAQQSNGCIDSLQIRYGYWCPTDFEPLCGCNNITYRNLCYLQNEGVVSYSEGPCEPVAIDFNPNPVSEMIYVNVVLKQEIGFSFAIYNYRGDQYYFNTFGASKEQIFNVNVNLFPPGIYMIIVQTDSGDYTWAKMVKYQV